MSTQAYYKDRLGFDPAEALNDGMSYGKTQQGYEESLTKFKDERDAIQKKTFTKWVNKHLKKASRHVGDLFEDLRDGHNLISLLEVLSGEHLPRERGRMRFHMLQNVQIALDFLRYRKIKLVNIRADDIVDGNPKLILGLIWTIILHFQISDIVVGQETNISARDALLRWARRSTAKYPGVRVSDFTSSWRDGMAFNALIHRNRPDLIDWRSIRSRVVRERLETAFTVAEREYGVTRLLDPEDVDTPEPDEKSLITYISSLYDVFPEPPPIHPLYDSESQQRLSEYRELASSLHLWMREKISIMLDRTFPSTLIEMKKLATESNRFRSDEIPPRQRDKQKLHLIYRELEKYFEAVGEVDIESELQYEVIDKNWNRLMIAHQDRDHAILEEIKRLERLQRLAEKVHREVKQVDSRLGELEVRVEEEARRLDRLHPLDAKHNVDLLETELRGTEEAINSMFTDTQVLREGRYPQAPELHKRVQKLHQRWVSLRQLVHTHLVSPLASLSFPVEERTVTRQTRTVLETRLVDTNVHFRQLQECSEWCRAKLKQLQDAEYGSDLPSVQNELELHQREHRIIEQFQTKIEHCSLAKSNFHGEELQLYNQHLGQLQKLYNELLVTSNKRLSDLEVLQDFLQSATNELVWLNDKEETEVTRDWSDKSLNVPALEQYYESLMSELEKREIQFSAVQDRGESLVLQHHPAAKCIEAYMAAMQTQWAWLLQLTLCLETHLKHAAHYQQFYRDLHDAEAWIAKRDELLNTIYSKSDFTLDEGERLLKGMQELRDELNQYTTVIQRIAERATEVIPLKQRRQPVTRPTAVTAVCSYKQVNIIIEKGEKCVLHDNSGRVKWRVSNSSGQESTVPGVCFLIPPPDKDAVDAADRLRRQFDRSTALWQKKQLRMRQNMIFATIKVVKSWDLAQFLAMGQEQRSAIRKALNEDADKLLQEGDPADPQLRRLKREMEEVNRLFDEFERRARDEEDSKSASRSFNESASTLAAALDDAERTLNTRTAAPLPRDVDSLEHLVIEHKDFETRLQALGPDVEKLQSTFRSISRKTPEQQSRLDKCISKWNNLWSTSHLYIERLKCVEIVLSGLEEATNIVTEFELKLASYKELPSDVEALRAVHEDLLNLQNSVAQHQMVIDQLSEDVLNARRLVEKSRPNHRGPHSDLERLEAEVGRLTNRWGNVCSQLVDRLRSCEAAYGLLQTYSNSYEKEVAWVDESYGKLSGLAPIEDRAKEQLEPTRVLYNNVLEKAPAIEQVNVVGGRFIREAKIYDLRLQHYASWLVDEVHPSMDTVIGRSRANGDSRADRIPGATAVAAQLDSLNHRYRALLSLLYDRLKQIATLCSNEPSVQVLVSQMEPRDLKTFRTEFNIYESTEESQFNSRQYTTKYQETRDGRKITVTTRGSRDGSPARKRQATEVDGGRPGVGGTDVSPGQTVGVPGGRGSSMNFSEIRSLRRIRQADEGTDVSDLLGITDPATGRVLTVGEAIALRVLDVRSGQVAGTPLREAVKCGLVEPALATRLLGPCGVGQLSLLEAIQRELADAERGVPSAGPEQSVEEKYKHCDETLSKLLMWLSNTENRIASQGNVAENTDDLRNQINTLKQVKDDLEAHSRPIATCLDQVRQLVSTGRDVLSADEVSTVEKNGRSLKTRYDCASERTERLLRKLGTARDELSKFRSELSTFNSWLDKARRQLDDKERSLSNLNKLHSSTDSTKEFVSDVIAHQADLRFITMAAQKFSDESKEYLSILNDFRGGLPERLPHVEHLAQSVVSQEVSEASVRYRDLLSRAEGLSDRLSGVGGRQREHQDALEKARAWMREAEPRAHKTLAEPTGADPRTLEEQLIRARSLSSEFVAQGRLIDAAKLSLEALLRSLEGQQTQAEVASLEAPVHELEDKYRQLSEALLEKCQELDTALVQSQSVQESLDSLTQWLNSAENNAKSLQRPASLQKERLDEQLREHRLLQADVDQHRPSIESVSQSAQELIATASNPRLAKKIDAKLKDVTSRFEKLSERTLRRTELLEDTLAALTSFSTQATKLETWCSQTVEALEACAGRLDAEELQARVDALATQKEAHKPEFEETVRAGRSLVGKKDVTDTVALRDRIKYLESQWKELGLQLEEKQRLGKARVDQLNAYERLHEQVIDWLTMMESRVQRLDPVAVDIDVLRTQIEELKPLHKEYREYVGTVDRLNDLGNAYDNLLRGDRPESPQRRRSSAYSPTKKTSVTASPLRRSSQEARSPSPTKSVGFNAQSPVSPGGSSGFSSRRSSQDGFHLEELSPVQQQLTEVNNRYGLLGVRLSDRQSELDSTREEVRRHMDSLRTLSAFLDKVQRSLPKEVVPQTKEEANKAAKSIKAVMEDMYEKQSLLDNTRGQVADLLKRKPSVQGSDTLHDELTDVVTRWKSMNDRCKDRIKLMDDIKEFYDTHDSLSAWLGAKDRMMTVLGPISSDSRMVQSQVQQVQVLREEFRTQQPQLSHLEEVGSAVLSKLDMSALDAQRISAKLTSLQQRWAELLARLQERADSLGAAADTSREFDAGLLRLRDALQALSDQLDEVPLDRDPEEQLRKVENLERQLEGQRPLLADAESTGAQLCDVLSDPASRAEIQGKLGAVGRQYNTLQKKMDHRKAEIEGNLRDGRQFEASCARTLGWLSDELGAMSERLLVSADREVLQQQLDQHEPVYKEVMSKEHEVIMLLNKGRDMLARSSQMQRSDSRNLQRDIDKIQSQWDRLRKDVMERHTRLQTCMEHCRKYYKAQENFLPWLSQAETKLEALAPASFKRKDIERQLKDLSAFRNEVWKRSGEFENNRTLGDTFVAACDIDKDVVKGELAQMKKRWDRLNNELLERTQSLEDTARRLTDFSENLRDLTHSLQRCEDRLASHDALGGAAKDPKLLDRIKTLREETTALRKPLSAVRQQAGDLCHEAGELGVDASHLQDEVDGIGDRLDDLQAKLDDRCSELQSAATAVTQFTDQVKGLSHDLSNLEQELENMKPPGRDLKTVHTQQDEITKLIRKLSRVSDNVADTVSAGERLVDSGFAPDTAATREQADLLRRQLARLEERGRAREEELATTLDRLETFYQTHSGIIEDIRHVSDELHHLKPVGSEVDTIRAQQEEFRIFRDKEVEPLASRIDECNRLGQGLIQSASGGVSTVNLEKDLEKMNDKWNDLKERLNERDRKLDVGLLQSGKFQEALDGLSKWLTDTEEMVANQKPPSADYKVVKAQLQEQKFLKKMLLDRQNSMSSLFAMGNEVVAGADPAERKAIERQLHELMQRFDNLTENATQRMNALEQAMAVAKDFQDRLVPIVEWLDKTEKKVKDMELVPTDEEKIQQRIKEHDALHTEILRHKTDLSELTDVAGELMGLVGEDEAAGLADRLQVAADRYTALVDASEAVGALLSQSRTGLRHLVLGYQDLQAWMDGADQRLSKFRILAVHVDKLLAQMEDLADLTEEVANHQSQVDGTVDTGLELMKHISSDEALALKDKLDSLQRRFNDLTSRGADMLKHAQEALPLVQNFHNCHNRLVDWMMGAEAQLQAAEPREDDIQRLELDIQEFRPVLEVINLVGPQLYQISPGEGASTIEGLVTRDNRRFDAIAEQIQRKGERIQLSKQRSLEVIGDIDELLDWFREVEGQIREAEPPSSEPDVIRVQLKEHKALNDDISSQKGRVRDVLSTAKKVLRESAQHEDTSTIREKMEDLREMMDTVSGLSSDRLGVLEQALALAEHFNETHDGLASWLTDTEQQLTVLAAMPTLRPDLIAQQQDRNELLMQSINEHKPLVEKLNKTGEALVKLVSDDEAAKVQEIVENDNARYAALRSDLRQRQQALEKALQESSQFSDKLEGMLRALGSTADQVHAAEPVSAHPSRIRDQMEENTALVEDLDKRQEAYAAVKRAADDVISKAGNTSDPAVKDIKRKLERLNSLWNEVQRATGERGRSLEDTLAVAERFWDELHNVMATLRELQDSLNSQEPAAVQPAAIQQQQEALQEIRHEIDQTKPEVDQCRQTGQELMSLCGEPDKPEVKKHIEDLDNAWDNITALYAKREENLIDAMEKAMEFHETLQNLVEFLDSAEDQFSSMGALGSDIDAVKKQIEQLKDFKAEVDPHMVKVEALNRQAQELTERTSAEQAAAIKEPLSAVNARWDDLLRGVVERQRQLENALLRLGQFQHALAELLVWIDKTDSTLTELKPHAGDPQALEVELAKLKVLVNDIQAHQTSVDTLNDAGRQLIEQGQGSAEAGATQERLSQLNRRWRELLDRAAERQRELEEALKEAQQFSAELQDMLSWLGDVDAAIAASKPVGGLPETASEQLERFMEVFNELEQNRPKVETVLQQGNEYLKKSGANTGHLQHNLKTLKTRWDSVTARANDKKIKLEIALKEATEFHDALQSFVDWLTNAEKTLGGLKPVSRVMETILGQIEEHKAFQKEVGVRRETMLNLDKKGTHLKYFSQKQDVILIKNLLISVQHRWERVVSKSAERTRALDFGYKEAREFHDGWSALMTWLEDTERNLDELAEDAAAGNDPEKIKTRLAKHREFQRALAGKQTAYDTTMRAGKSLKERAPKTDEPALRQMLTDLKARWTSVCAKSVDRQRRLEEALLFSGQFKDAVQALLDWLHKVESTLGEEGPVHGDLDTVVALVEQHKTFEEDLRSRQAQMESVQNTGRELQAKATAADAATIQAQLVELTTLWETVTVLSRKKTHRLEEALKEAEKLHKAVNMLLEWLSDAEMRLRFTAALPEDEQDTRNQLAEHDKFMKEMMDKEKEKNATIALAQEILAKAHPDGAAVIKHWITIIQSRWEEVFSWATQREQRLKDHLAALRDLEGLLEELLAWLAGLEGTLVDLEREPLPDDLPTLEALVADHRQFMENTSKRQTEVDSVCKSRQVKPAEAQRDRKLSRPKTPSSRDARENRESSPEHDPASRKSSRASPGREKAPELQPHIGPRFAAKGSKGAEPQFRNPRVKLLWDRWRNVWLLAWERQRRLQERLAYLQELEKVKNFSWDDWRKRFLKFMNHKKSRLTDLFRKMDKNNDGLIPREDFIDGIMKTKFDTSRLEMNAVADLFDRNSEGFIDWKEFIAALRPDWVEPTKPVTDADKIHDEVKRLVMLCTCRQKFRVFQVGEGKYRFGDSQKLRLVRILRSTVMVRVGGGWVALDEFLQKNDPCRAKGRTNIELREQFILAEGVSQSMTAFKPKASPGSGSTPQRSQSLAGPITKVRERSARSVPMGRPSGRSSFSGGARTPDSLSDNESTLPRPLRKGSAPPRSSLTPGGSLPGSKAGSRAGSRPGSRQGSKPPSRHGSTLSLDSTDEGTPSRIPVQRRTVGATTTPPARGGTSASSSRKLTAPVNGTPGGSRPRTPTGGSRPRTPTGLLSPASGSSSRARTPSGSSTPVPGVPTSGTKIARRSSGASDTGTAAARKGSSASTPTEKRAPFRL